ncbi:MAG: hypothetical protein HZC46_03835 [Ignavibacterium album]|uniref:hypothetical protein n=1 Tax=Ignavibacterium album TaxID=591197 RepID=UPI0026EA69D1|nr:hypothetical protein [Ignavibacterium album]MBI5661260.1 hypothetical protein [Ignavibacterium album]
MKKIENKKLPKRDITDVNISFEEIRKEINQISSRMTELGLEFINKMDGNLISDKNKRFMTIRNSIQYRLNSILFHYTQLLDIQIRFQERIDEDPYDIEKCVKWMVLGGEQQYALFDSIIFHIVSLFDYLACLINYSCSGKFESKLKWNSIIKTSFDQNSFLLNSELKTILQKWNNEFVDTLYNHRSDLIHYNMDLGNTSYIIDIMKGKALLEIEAPYRFVKGFRELKKLSQENKIMINYSIDWAIKKSLSATKEIIKGVSTFMDVNRKVPKERDVFIIKK